MRVGYVQHYENTETVLLLNLDPRLLPEALIDPGVPLQTISHV